MSSRPQSTYYFDSSRLVTYYYAWCSDSPGHVDSASRLVHRWTLQLVCGCDTDLQVFCSLGGVIFRTSWGLALGAVALSEGRRTGHYSEMAFRECDQAEAKDGNHCNDTLLCVEAGKHSEVGP